MQVYAKFENTKIVYAKFELVSVPGNSFKIEEVLTLVINTMSE